MKDNIMKLLDSIKEDYPKSYDLIDKLFTLSNQEQVSTILLKLIDQFEKVSNQSK